MRTAVVHAHQPGTTGVMAPLTGDELHWARENLLRIELAGLEYEVEDRVDLRRVGGMLTVQGVGMWLSMRHG